MPEFSKPILEPPKLVTNFILPKIQRAKAQSAMLLPIKKELANQAKLILKGVGMALLKPKLFSYNVKKAEEEQSVYQAGVGGETYDKKSFLGLPVFDTITFEMDAYEDNNGQQIPATRSTLDIALIEINQPKNIVVTKIAGKNGTVKEYMSDDDYHITINGVLANEFLSMSPAKAIQDLVGISKAPITLHVNSGFLQFFEISDLVIMSYTIKQREGERNVVDINMECLSDVPFEIQAAE